MISNNNMYSPAQSQAVNAIGSRDLRVLILNATAVGSTPLSLLAGWLAGLHDHRSSGPITAVRQIVPKRRYNGTVLLALWRLSRVCSFFHFIDFSFSLKGQ